MAADRQLPRTVAEAILALGLPGDLAWLPVNDAEERLCYVHGDERFTVARLIRGHEGWDLWDVTNRRIARYGPIRRDPPLEWATGWLRIPNWRQADAH